MTVHTEEAKIQVSTMSFEARFDDGWRYLDSCGETISRIRQLDKNWGIAKANVQSTVMAHDKKQLVIRFDNDRMVVSKNGEALISTLKAEEISKELATSANELSKIVTETLAIPNTTRVGARFVFLASADSLEDAERCVSRHLSNPITSFICQKVNSEFYTADCQFRFDEEQTGYRRTVRIGVRSEADVVTGPLTGLSGEKVKSFVTIDVDTFTKPESGHFEQTERFVESTYTRSHALAYELFQKLSTK